MLALAIAVAVVSSLAVTGCSSGRSTKPPKPTGTASSTPKARTTVKCVGAGCAVVSATRNLPPVAILYGASCHGVHGSWFLNAVEGGGIDSLRPAYTLLWSFPDGATAARPSARVINIPHTKTTTISISLVNGKMKLHGVRKPNTTVDATGSLTVKLSGSASAPSLIFIEKGLSRAEHRLGLVSPFDNHGRPLVVPIKRVARLAGC
jgi:hypothetical protein